MEDLPVGFFLDFHFNRRIKKMENINPVICAECVKEKAKKVLMKCTTPNGEKLQCIDRFGRKCKNGNCPKYFSDTTAGICWPHIHWRRAMEYQRKVLKSIYNGEGIA